MARLLVVGAQDRSDQAGWAVLRAYGHDVVAVVTGAEALGAARDDPFDLVVTDLLLPDTDGIEVLRRLRLRSQPPPVVVVATALSPFAMRHAFTLGARDVLTRPLVLEDFQALGRLAQTHSVERHSPRRLASTASRDDQQADHADGPATAAWVRAVLPVVRAPADIRTVARWAAAIGTSGSTVKRLCTCVGVTPGDSLDFARILRVVLRRGGTPCDWYDELAVVEARTLLRMLQRAGCAAQGEAPRVDDFCATQTYVPRASLVRAIQARVRAAP